MAGGILPDYIPGGGQAESQSGEDDPSTTAPFVVEDGTGLTNANSYLSVANADAYHDAQGNPDAWLNADTAAKQDALRLATKRDIDARLATRWPGARTHQTQALAWPRIGVIDRDGYPIDSDALPQALLDLTAVYALDRVSGTSATPTLEQAGVVKSKTERVGPITESVEYIGGNSPLPVNTLAEALEEQLTEDRFKVYRG